MSATGKSTQNESIEVVLFCSRKLGKNPGYTAPRETKASFWSLRVSEGTVFDKKARKLAAKYQIITRPSSDTVPYYYLSSRYIISFAKLK